MQITLTKEQVREAFGELRYMGADYCYKYDKETRKMKCYNKVVTEVANKI